MAETHKQVLGWKAPQGACEDRKCPFHGELLVKRELFQGVVVKKDSNRSATITWDRSRLVPKYERYALLRSRLRVHNPACINAQLGEMVVAARTKPLSKTKHHVIIGRVGGKA